MRSQRIRWSRLAVQKPVRLGKNVPLMIMSLTGHPLHPRCHSDVEAGGIDWGRQLPELYPTGVVLSLLLLPQKLLSQRYFTNICAQSCLCASLCLKQHGTDTIPGAVYTSESLLSDGGGWKEKKDTMWKWSLSANVLRLWQGSLSKPPFWKALKINNHWPKSILPVISHITWHSPAEVHKPLNYIPNIPSAGLSNFECVVSEISLRALDKQAPNNWTSWLN